MSITRYLTLFICFFKLNAVSDCVWHVFKHFLFVANKMNNLSFNLNTIIISQSEIFELDYERKAIVR
jgi:hypothetical protein